MCASIYPKQTRHLNWRKCCYSEDFEVQALKNMFSDRIEAQTAQTRSETPRRRDAHISPGMFSLRILEWAPAELAWTQRSSITTNVVQM